MRRVVWWQHRLGVWHLVDRAYGVRGYQWWTLCHRHGVYGPDGALSYGWTNGPTPPAGMPMCSACRERYERAAYPQ